MGKIGKNVIVLLFCWLIVTGSGIYLTFVRQPKLLEGLKNAEQVARMKNAELISLQTEEVTLTRRTEDALRKWNTRYKTIPDELTTPDVMAYLNDLTSEGFESFDVTMRSVQAAQDYSYYTFAVSGRGFYDRLYQFIWDIENYRDFYRISDLALNHIDLVTEHPDLGTDQLQVMVSFKMDIHAYFNGIEGASASDDLFADLTEEIGIPLSDQNSLPPVPLEMLPDQQPATNPFHPVIMEQIPPNTYELINVETALLVSIVGGEAVFQDEKGYRTVGEGDDVYLGQIVEIDSHEGRVLASLNKGGIIDEIELSIQLEEPFEKP